MNTILLYKISKKKVKPFRRYFLKKIINLGFANWQTSVIHHPPTFSALTKQFFYCTIL